METSENLKIVFCSYTGHDVVAVRDTDADGCEDEWLHCHNNDEEPYSSELEAMHDKHDVDQYRNEGTNADFYNPFLKRLQRERPDFDSQGM